MLQIVDADTYEVLRRYDLRAALDERGLEDFSTAVRPMTLSPNEQKIYFQLSFFHGFLEMDRSTGDIQRVKRLPNLVPDMPREQYLLDSAHHGIAMNPSGTKICVAGTMSDYATVVERDSYQRGKLLKKEDGKPYWVTQSWDGDYCYISWSGTDQVSKISYATGRIVDTANVGDHPQRVRNAFVEQSLIDGLPDGLDRKRHRTRRVRKPPLNGRGSRRAARARPRRRAGAGEAEPDVAVADLGVEVDAGRDRDAGLAEQVVGEAHRVVGQVADVGVHVERAVGRRQTGDAEGGQPLEQEGRLPAYRATWPSSSAYDASSKAAHAANCARTGGQIVKLPVSTSTGRRSRSGTSIQPIRQPVIEKYFENELNTTASREVSHAERESGVSPSSGAYSIPW